MMLFPVELIDALRGTTNVIAADGKDIKK